jgi:hypothetical protein
LLVSTQRASFARLDPLWAGKSQLICPTGGPAKILSIPSAKNISLAPSGKSGAMSRASRAERGALANVINAARDAMDADAPNDERC